jgi:hypothetical protein
MRTLHDLNTETVGTIRFKTCIRRNLSHSDPSEHLNHSQDPFTYSAISYAWGNPTPKHQIFVDGEPREIAENLWQFLLQAKPQPEALSGWLWIDALSIDQSNPEERRHQVGIMSSIFRNACLVWNDPRCCQLWIYRCIACRHSFPRRSRVSREPSLLEPAYFRDLYLNNILIHIYPISKNLSASHCLSSSTPSPHSSSTVNILNITHQLVAKLDLHTAESVTASTSL